MKRVPTQIRPIGRVRRLRDCLPVALVGRDAEGVHELRVSARRLMTFIDLGGGDASLRTELKWSRAAAGVVRDLDVQIAVLGKGRSAGTLLQGEPDASAVALQTWLRDQLGHSRPILVEVLECDRTLALMRRLDVLAPLERRLAVARLRKLTARAVRAAGAVDPARGRAPIGDLVLGDLCRGDRFFDDRFFGDRFFDDRYLDDLHRLRRRVRVLRYALDWLRLDPAPVAAVQGVLGEINDAAVGLDLLHRWPGAAPVAAANLRARIDSLTPRVFPAWRVARDHVQAVLRDPKRPASWGESAASGARVGLRSGRSARRKPGSKKVPAKA